MMKNYPLLLRKFMADKAKVPSLIEIIVHMNLELYSLKRQEQVGNCLCCPCLLYDISLQLSLTASAFMLSEFQKCPSTYQRGIF